MQQRLALSWPASQIARLATALDLCNVPPDCFPALDLPCVLYGQPTAHVIATIPLKPAPRIIGMYPSFLSPNRKSLARTDSKVIQRAVAGGRREPRADKPAIRKFLAAVRHVLTAEHAKRKHLLRCKFGAKFRIEIATDGLSENVAVATLHLVVDGDLDVSPAHGRECSGPCGVGKRGHTSPWPDLFRLVSVIHVFLLADQDVDARDPSTPRLRRP